jgi:predicted ATPase/DNA-binding SARP family transcriptional activator
LKPRGRGREAKPQPDALDPAAWQDRRVQIAMLGPLEVRTEDGEPADVPGARLRAVLIALALRPNQVVPKASLVDWVWGENPPADAANALQRLVSRLRKALPGTAVDGLTDGYRLTVDPDAVDAVRFERLVSASQAAGPAQDVAERARLLREASALWRGDAMQDVGLQESGAFDAVLVRLEALRLTAAEDRFDAELALGRGPESVTGLTDLVAAHPTRERLVNALMRALNAAGRDNEALQLYQRTREALADELGADPSAELSALHVALLRGELGGRRREEPRTTNLRAELTSFVGREADVAAVRDLVDGHRLTTVIGPGGAGKTRLAGETARALLGTLPDGAWLVELAAISPDADVAQAALSALGLRDTLLGDNPNAEPTDRFIAAMRERQALIVLDNCEHVIESAAVFAHRVLGECRGLRVLATSREPLGITGEALWPVVPLALPAEDATSQEIEASPAVQLLRDRAEAVRRDLSVDANQLATMARICRALDGSPLAIELAAARLRTMSVEQLAHRLDDRFRLLTGGSRIALPRHRTLRAVVDWSWELLSDEERVVLRRLSVFAGGASLEAAEHVCAGEEIYPELVLELLTTLTEKSLLAADGAGTDNAEGVDAPRYRMSGTIREYAAQRLAEAGEEETARQAHLAYFTALTETAEPHLRSRDQLEWLARIQAEHDDIAAAMRGALAAGEAQPAMRLAAGSGWYWWLAGYRAEGLELLTAAAAVPGETTAGVRAVVCSLIVMFASAGRGDEHTAAEWVHKAHQASQLARETEPGARRHPGVALVEPMERMLRAPQDALSAFEPELADDDPWVRALARLQMGKLRVMFGQGGTDADEYLETALAEFQALGERFGISFGLTALAERVAVRGEFTRAGDLYEQAIVAVSEVGAPEEVIEMRARQAVMFAMAGDRDSAAASIADAERRARRVTWPSALAELALAKADLARWDGDAGQARRQIDLATSLVTDDTRQANYRALRHDLLSRVTEDLDGARAEAAAAFQTASEVGLPMLLASVVVGTADLALRRGQTEQAARLLGAAAALRGLPDSAHPDVARIEREARNRLGDKEFAEAVLEGARTELSELTQVTLAS